MLNIPPKKPDLNYSNPRLVWSGSATTVYMSALTEGGPGWYWVLSGSAARHLIYVNSALNSTQTAAGKGQASGTLISIYWVYFNPVSDYFRVYQSKHTTTDSQTETTVPITEIYKL